MPKGYVYFAKKTIFFVVEIFVALTLNFIIPRLMPGNPVSALLARFIGKGHVNPALVQAVKDLFGVSNQPIYIQYIDYLKNTLTGNLGVSFTYYPTPVTTIIAEALPFDLILLGISTILSFILGSLIGVILAWKRGGVLDNLITNVFNFLGNFPYFFIALLMLYIFAEILHWFPNGGMYSPNVEPGFTISFILSYLHHFILPALSLVITSLGGWLLLTRNVAITNIYEDFSTYAQAAGVSFKDYLLYYLGKTSILPSFTSFGISLGFIVSGAILVEEVFDYPGIGYVLVQAIESNDYPLIQAIFLLIVLAVLTATYIMDLVYGFIDPRVRSQ